MVASAICPKLLDPLVSHISAQANQAEEANTLPPGYLSIRVSEAIGSEIKKETQPAAPTQDTQDGSERYMFRSPWTEYLNLRWGTRQGCLGSLGGNRRMAN